MKRGWEEQQQRWLRFQAWEREHARSIPRDYVRALAWMSEAWETAARHSPYWGSKESARDHWRHLAEMRRRLSRMGSAS